MWKLINIAAAVHNDCNDWGGPLPFMTLDMICAGNNTNAKDKVNVTKNMKKFKCKINTNINVYKKT